VSIKRKKHFVISFFKKSKKKNSRQERASRVIHHGGFNCISHNDSFNFINHFTIREKPTFIFFKKGKKSWNFLGQEEDYVGYFCPFQELCVCVYISAGATVWMMMMMMSRSGAFSSDFRATPKRNKSLKSKLLLLLPCVMQIA
jgi:hypothetical protein